MVDKTGRGCFHVSMARALRYVWSEPAGGLHYAVVSNAMARFDQRLRLDAPLRKKVAALQEQLSNGKTWPQCFLDCWVQRLPGLGLKAK